MSGSASNPEMQSEPGDVNSSCMYNATLHAQFACSAGTADDLFSVMAVLQKNCKLCPACGMAIERSEGCNHMICTSCGGHFCYKCNQQIEGYKHYWGGNCILFDLSEIERWEAQMGQRMM